MRPAAFVPCILPLLLACRSGTTSDLEATVASYGFDYGRIREDARKSREALMGYFLFSAVVDTAAADAYAHDLYTLLDHWGDAAFDDVLGSVGCRLREDVMDILSFESGYPGENEASWLLFEARFPRVSRRVRAPKANTVAETLTWIPEEGREVAIDVSALAEDYNGTMFVPWTLSLAGEEFLFLGFEPGLKEVLRNRWGRVEVIEAWVGSRPHGTLYLVRDGSRLQAAKVISLRGSSEGNGLTPGDVRKALVLDEPRIKFTLLKPGTVYVESWLWDDLKKKRVSIPATWKPLPDVRLE